MPDVCVYVQVLSITLATIKNCEDFKQQYIKYDFLWKQDLHKTLQVGQDASRETEFWQPAACACMAI